MYYHLNSFSQFVLAALIISVAQTFEGFAAPIELLGIFLGTFAILRTVSYFGFILLKFAAQRIRTAKAAK